MLNKDSKLPLDRKGTSPPSLQNGKRIFLASLIPLLFPTEEEKLAKFRISELPMVPPLDSPSHIKT
jgi:hypothetical protein